MIPSMWKDDICIKKKSVKDEAEFFTVVTSGDLRVWWVFSLLASFWKVWTFTMTMCDFLKLIFNVGDLYSKKIRHKKIYYDKSFYSSSSQKHLLLSVSHVAFGGILCLPKHSLIYSFFPFKCELSHSSESCLFPFRVWEAEGCPVQRCTVQIPRTCECAHLHGKRNSASVSRWRMSRWGIIQVEPVWSEGSSQVELKNQKRRRCDDKQGLESEWDLMLCCVEDWGTGVMSKKKK